jgi:hypothetical protein
VLVRGQRWQNGIDLVPTHQDDNQVVDILWRKLLDDVYVGGRALPGVYIFEYDAIRAQIGQALPAREQHYRMPAACKRAAYRLPKTPAP